MYMYGERMAVVYLTMGTKAETTSATKLSTYHTTTIHTPIRFVKEWMQSKEFFSLRIIPWPLNCSPRSFHLKKQGEWDDLVQNLPKAGLVTDHVCQALPTPESGQLEALWFTPTATSIGTRADQAMAKRIEYRESIGRSSVPPGCLAEQVSASGYTPIQDMRQAWPTRNVSDGYNANLKDDHDIKRGYLRGVVRLWPEQQQGQLNPDWVEWLMGFPTLWSVADQKFI